MVVEDTTKDQPDEKAQEVDTDKATATVPATVSPGQDPEEPKAEVTPIPAAEEPKREGVTSQDLNATSCQAQMEVENVASEIEETQEGSQKKEAPEELEEVHKEAVAMDDVKEDGKRVLRVRTPVVTPRDRRKYTRRSQKVQQDDQSAEESKKQVDEPKEKDAKTASELNEGLAEVCKQEFLLKQAFILFVSICFPRHLL